MIFVYWYPNRDELLHRAPVLQLDPAVPGVFGGPYPFGIDPVRVLSNIVFKIYALCMYVTSICLVPC